MKAIWDTWFEDTEYENEQDFGSGPDLATFLWPLSFARGNKVQEIDRDGDRNTQECSVALQQAQGIHTLIHLSFFPDGSWPFDLAEHREQCSLLEQPTINKENVDVLSACLIIKDNSIL